MGSQCLSWLRCFLRLAFLFMLLEDAAPRSVPLKPSLIHQHQPNLFIHTHTQSKESFFLTILVCSCGHIVMQMCLRGPQGL